LIGDINFKKERSVSEVVPEFTLDREDSYVTRVQRNKKVDWVFKLNESGVFMPRNIFGVFNWQGIIGRAQYSYILLKERPLELRRGVNCDSECK
jgi:hypothetical protein